MPKKTSILGSVFIMFIFCLIIAEGNIARSDETFIPIDDEISETIDLQIQFVGNKDEKIFGQLMQIHLINDLGEVEQKFLQPDINNHIYSLSINIFEIFAIEIYGPQERHISLDQKYWQKVISINSIKFSEFNNAPLTGLSNPREIKIHVKPTLSKLIVKGMYGRKKLVLIEPTSEDPFHIKQDIWSGTSSTIRFNWYPYTNDQNNDQYLAIKTKTNFLIMSGFFDRKGKYLFFDQTRKGYQKFHPEINNYFWPTACTYITQKYSRKHKGIDIAGPVGTDVFAIASGKVRKAKYVKGYGRVIFVTHNDGTESVYAHLHKIKIKKGTDVEQGRLIGAMGNSGKSTGPHLHFEIRKSRKLLDPLKFYN